MLKPVGLPRTAALGEYVAHVGSRLVFRLGVSVVALSILWAVLQHDPTCTPMTRGGAGRDPICFPNPVGPRVLVVLLALVSGFAAIRITTKGIPAAMRHLRRRRGQGRAAALDAVTRATLIVPRIW